VTRAISLLFHDVYVEEAAESGFVSEAADRYKLRLAEFEAQLERIAAARSDAPLLVGRGESGARGDGSTQRSLRSQERREEPSSLRARPTQRPAGMPWLITFDDGGVSYHTLIADRLEARGWRGHCFVTTDCIARRGFLDAAQIRDLDARGHVIGSHSASHPTRFSACSLTEMVDEWRQSRHTLEDLLGHAVQVASVPGGYFSPVVGRAAREAGITTLFTSEPVTSIAIDADFTLIGRFTIRRSDATETAMRWVLPAPWARFAAWTSWNAKGLIKPLLGPAYMRLADWLLAARRPAPASVPAGDLRRGRSS
jgi:peptidoglycan/xylan/chitin deacetylase (PgdA/CDA1 family)